MGSTFVTASCDAGDTVLSGGYRLEGIRPAQTGLVLFDNGPSGEGWRVVTYNDSDATGLNVTYAVTTYAICADLN